MTMTNPGTATTPTQLCFAQLLRENYDSFNITIVKPAATSNSLVIQQQSWLKLIGHHKKLYNEDQSFFTVNIASR